MRTARFLLPSVGMGLALVAGLAAPQTAQAQCYTSYGYYYPPAPVVVAPAPVIVAPVPVVVAPPPVVAPPVVVAPAPVYRSGPAFGFSFGFNRGPSRCGYRGPYHGGRSYHGGSGFGFSFGYGG